MKLLLSFATLIAFGLNSLYAQEWIPLFNGKNLDGWDIKITGHDLNDNYLNTFRVEDGILKCSYDQYEKFDDKFGHLYYRTPFHIIACGSNTGLPATKRPAALASGTSGNSGVMLHSQPAETVTKNQTFPVSLEMQMLGGLSDGKERTTANLCTPGTMVEIGGKLSTDHCINSTSKTYDGDQWVTVEMLVLGDSLVQHFIEGEMVFEYRKPIVADDAQMLSYLNMENDWFEKHKGLPLSSGHIALQAESHPVEFRRVELLDLSQQYSDKNKDK